MSEKAVGSSINPAASGVQCEAISHSGQIHFLFTDKGLDMHASLENPLSVATDKFTVHLLYTSAIFATLS